MQAALGLAIAVVLLVTDLVAGWRWSDVVLAVLSLGCAASFARGALDWYEPRRALDDTPDAR